MRPESCQPVVARLAFLFHDLLRVRRKVVDDNLRAALPHLDEAQRSRLGRRMWEHVLLLVIEFALAPRKIHETNWRSFIHFHRADELARLLLSERPTLLISAHYGNFELAGYILGIMGYPTCAVARTFDNPYLARFIDRFRGVTGQQIVPKKGGYEQIVSVLNRGGTLSFLADQYAGTKGCWVEFFGRAASTHKAIALFALEHEARLVVGYARRSGRPLCYEMGVEAILDPREAGHLAAGVRPLTQWYTSQLETIIRAAPDQYWWLHRRWKDHRKPRRKVKGEGAKGHGTGGDTGAAPQGRTRLAG